MFSALYHIFFKKIRSDKKGSQCNASTSKSDLVSCKICKKLIPKEHRFCGYCGKEQV